MTARNRAYVGTDPIRYGTRREIVKYVQGKTGKVVRVRQRNVPATTGVITCTPKIR